MDAARASTVRPIRQPTGSEEFSELFLDGARTNADLVVGEVGGGWRVAMGTLGFERGVGSLGMQLSFAQQLDDLVDARTTHRPIDDAAIRDDARAVVERGPDHAATRRNASLAALERRRARRGASISKLYWSQWFQRFGELAMQDPRRRRRSCARTPTSTDGLQQTFLFGRAVTIFAGCSEIQRNILGESVLGLPREPR